METYTQQKKRHQDEIGSFTNGGIMRQVKFIKEDSGNFRNYYRGLNDRRLYCTAPASMLTLSQWRAQGEPLDWYECSRNGEPSHRVNNIEVIS